MTAKISIRGVVAVLGDDGVWASDRKQLAIALNKVFGLAQYPPSPSAGRGQFAAQAVAAGRRLAAVVTWPKSQDVEGRVY